MFSMARVCFGMCRYHFDIVDAWKDHTPRPFNSLPDTYNFLVRKPILWRMAYMSQQPRIIHEPYLWGCGNVIGEHVNDLYAYLAYCAC
jgi:1,2-diacylglycerol 3-beta-galactosyltransferase